MKRLMQSVIVIFLFIYCGCGKYKTPIEGPNNVVMGSAVIFQKTGESFEIHVKYLRKRGIGDDVSLTINGQRGKLLETDDGLLTGVQHRFEFQPVFNAGDQIMKLLIRNGKITYEFNRVLRFVEDYSLASLWENMDADYYSVVKILARRGVLGGIQMVGTKAADQILRPGPWIIGTYLEREYEGSLERSVKFLSGLNGEYSVLFDEKGKINQLDIWHAYFFPPNDQLQEVLADVKTIPDVEYIGRGVEEDFFQNDVYLFRQGEFLIKVRDKKENIYTTITKE